MTNGRIEKDIFPGLMLAPFHYACFTRFVGYSEDQVFLSHHCFQIILGLSGTLHFGLAEGKRSIVSDPGSIFVLSPGVRHNWHSEPNAVCENFMFFCDGFTETESDLGRIFNIKRSEMIWLFHLEPANYDFYVTQFRELIRHHDQCNANIMHGLLYAFCGMICRRAGWLYEHLDGMEQHPALCKAIDTLKRDYREQISLKQLSRYCGLGPSRLSELFRQHLGMSPMQYRNEHRIKKAMQLLNYSDMNITQIAEFLGFQSVHYFSRFFKNHTGSSPTNFLAKVQKKMLLDN